MLLKVIERDSLLDHTRKTGEYLLTSLQDLQHESGGMITNVRGVGTFCAMDVPSTAQRAQLLQQLLSKGLLVGGCGDRTIRFRPSLVLEESHVDEAIAILGSCMRS